MASKALEEQVVQPRDKAQLQAEIDRAGDEIRATMADLSAEVSASTDWREWVRRRPGVVLGGAFCIGFLIGSRRRNR
jgi:hypothetical protein